MIYKFKELENLGIKHAFIGKPWDMSRNNKNRLQEISDVLEVDAAKIYDSVQKHTDKVAIVYDGDKTTDEKFVNNDGLITNVKGITLLTYVADCQGIFLYDDEKKVIGNIHAGWRGVAKKIVIKALDIMVKEFGSDVKNIKCFINPSIHQCHFEIEDDVLNYFIDIFDKTYIEPFVILGKDNKGIKKYYFDLIGLNKKILMDYGILKENIYVLDMCTMCESEFYSYRREKTDCRNGCLISLSE